MNDRDRIVTELADAVREGLPPLLTRVEVSPALYAAVDLAQVQHSALDELARLARGELARFDLAVRGGVSVRAWMPR